MILKNLMNSLNSLYMNASIKYKILLLNVVVILISLSVFAFFANKVSTQAIIRKAEMNSDRELALIVKNLQTMVNDTENYARIFSMDEKLQLQLERIKAIPLDPLEKSENVSILNRILGIFVEPNTNIATVSILTRQQILLDVGSADNTGLYAILGTDFINRVQKEKKPVWKGPFKLKLKSLRQDNVFAVAKAVVNINTGETTGTAVLYVREKDITSTYLDNYGDPHNQFFIINEDGIIISSIDKNDLYRNINDVIKIDHKNSIDLFRTNKATFSSDGRQVLLTNKNFEKLNWKIISIIPLDKITMENKEINRLIIVSALICLIFSILAALQLSKTISKPVHKLVRIMKSVQYGNMDVKADFIAKDEIGILGESFNSLMDTIKDLLNRVYAEQKQKREYEFNLIQSQINPHFLYNTLETIISFIKLKMEDNAITSTRYLASFYRISLNNGKSIITLGEEVQLTENYLNIQKLRYIEYIDFSMQFDKSILDCKIPKLTLQPLVENSIYHGLKQKKGKGYLLVKGYLADDCIQLEVYDNGVGMPEGKILQVLDPKAGHNNHDFGVCSVNGRIKLLYGNNYGLVIESEKNSFTRVIVKLPIIRDGEVNNA